MIFSEIRGHARAIQFLRRILTNGRMAHAYLFSGPEGVGKATVARAIASSLLCMESEQLEPCGLCPGCRQFDSANHPDFLHILPDGASIRIDQIRALKRQLTFPPFAGEVRVILIDEAQAMRREAGNSLLKILEEPPPGNLFLLVASEAEPVLPTIVSRCQVVSFAPLAYELAAEIIAAHTPGLDRQHCQLLAKLSEGCPGRALTMQAGELLSLRDRIVTGLLHGGWSRARTIEEAIVIAREMASLSSGLELILDLLRLYFRDILLLSLQTLRQGDNTDQTTAKEILRARERWNLSQLSDKVRSIDSASRALTRNCNRGLVCEVLMLQLFE